MRHGALCLLLGALTACDDDVQRPRDVLLPVTTATESIDWSQSAGIFIGVEAFLGADDVPDVLYAADDATDLAWLFTQDLQSLLRPDRTLLFLSGRPDKERSQAHLLTMQREGVAVIDEFDSDRIYAHVRSFAEKVGQNGVLILFVATHGVTVSGEHVLLTPDATTSDVRGLVLSRLLQAIPSGHDNRLLLFVDACREPFAPAPARMFEDLLFPGRYAIFAASAPGGYALPDVTTHNGFFTAALRDALRCRAFTDANGFLTPNTIGAFVNAEVRKRTSASQRPEARFGGLEDVPLLRCVPPREAGEIIDPKPNARVDSTGDVAVRVFLANQYVTVFVCSRTGRCWKQNAEPIRALAGAVTQVGVQYGSPDRFSVHIALTADSDYLRGEVEFASLPNDRRADRIVHWLEPVTVTLEEEP